MAVDVETTIETLEDAHAEITSVGVETARSTREYYDRFAALVDRYREEATGTGEFESYVAFQEKMVDLLDRIDPETVYRAEDFEHAIDRFERRIIREKDFRRAERDLSAVRELVETIETAEELQAELEDERGRLESRRRELRSRLRTLEREIQDADRIEDVDPSELVSTIEAYNACVEDEFTEFLHSAPAIEVAGLGQKAADLPLVDVAPPDPAAVELLQSMDLGRETVPTLLEYAGYSDSKLAHYVDDPVEFRRTLPRAWFETLSADDFSVSMDESGAVMRYKLPELIRIVGEFADEECVGRLRKLHTLAETGEYDPMRRAHRVANDLGTTDVETLRERKSATESDLERIEERIERIESARRYFID